jgi:endonuclease/exonuclease/phosphatase family metal-dependent hydrolase
MIWPFFAYSFLYAVASAASIASMTFSRGMPRSSSSSPKHRIHYFKVKHIPLLPNYRHYFYPRAEFDVFDDDDRAYRIQYGNATFVRKTLPVVADRAEFVYGNYWTDLEDPPVPSNAHAVRIRYPGKEKDIVVAHMHGLWVKGSKQGSVERQIQGEHFLNLVHDMTQHWRLPSIVCGDFNILPSNVMFKHFAEHGYRELVTENNYTSTRTSIYIENPEKKDGSFFADYMLVSHELKVKRFEVLNLEPNPVSDHCPLVLDIE